MIYCIDTSSILFAKTSLPREYFPEFWDALEEMIANGTLISIEAVRDEIGKGDDLQEWMKENEKLFHDVTSDIGQAVKKVVAKAKALVNTKAERDEADPYVIALAIVKGGTVVTEESSKSGKQGKMKIPTACQHLDVRCINLHKMMSEMGYSFKLSRS